MNPSLVVDLVALLGFVVILAIVDRLARPALARLRARDGRPDPLAAMLSGHPVRGFVVVFFVAVGAVTLASELAGRETSVVVRYGAPAVFSSYLAWGWKRGSRPAGP